MSAALARPLDDEPARRSLADIAASLDYSSDWHWSWSRYRDMIVALTEDHGLRRHLEVGAGRDALFSPEEADGLGIRVTLNDISAAELALAPPGFDTVCCDVAAPDTMATIRPGAYDLVYSRMVMEHVRDARQLWRNQYAMLAPGGIGLAFVPTLYAPAFAANRLVPETVSGAVLRRLFPDRGQDGGNPKFPAFYDLCHGDPAKIEPVLRAIGFREVLVLPFYGYSYFWKIPGLRQLDAAFTRFVRGRDMRVFTSFAYILAVK